MRVYTVGVACVKPGQVCDSVDAAFQVVTKVYMLTSCLFSSAQCRPIERHYAKSIVRCMHVDYVRVPITSGSGDI